MRNLKIAVAVLATISIVIPDTLFPRVVDGICAANGYDVTITTQTKTQFAKAVLLNFIKATVRSAESQAAAQNASNQATQDFQGL